MKRYACVPVERVEEAGFSLSTVQPEHIEPIRRWRNAQLDVLRQSAPLTPEQQQAYFDSQIWPSLEQAEPRQILLAYFRDGALIGYGGLVHISWADRRAEVSFLLDPEPEANRRELPELFACYLGLIVRLAFSHLDLRRLVTETFAFRDTHIAVLEAQGFQREGRLREHVLVDGKPMDALMHGLLRGDRGTA